MKKTILKFKLVKFEKALAFQILYQDTDIFKRGDYKSGKNLTVKSGDFPGIGRDGCIYLRGEDCSDDNFVSRRTFDTNYKRDDFYEEVLSTLKSVCIEENEKRGCLPVEREPNTFEF